VVQPAELARFRIAQIGPFEVGVKDHDDSSFPAGFDAGH
jgi:hypothetical protein